MVPNGGDYDSPMMDLTMARNNNNQLNNASPREQQQHQQLQDYSHKLSHSKDICDGPILGVPAANGDGFPNDIDLLNRRQNPVGVSELQMNRRVNYLNFYLSLPSSPATPDGRGNGVGEGGVAEQNEIAGSFD